MHILVRLPISVPRREVIQVILRTSPRDDTGAYVVPVSATKREAGYSGTPLPTKLGIKSHHRVLIDGGPPGFAGTQLIPLPDGVTIHRRAARDVRSTPYDVVVAFRGSAGEYIDRLPRDIGRIKRDGSLWIAWPKKASGVVTDLTENVVRDEALAAGLVDVKVCAIDSVWSGLKLVYRRENR